ncbi:MAG: hypothetical protein ABI880_02630 [Acidobacteriota bacterium]
MVRPIVVAALALAACAGLASPGAAQTPPKPVVRKPAAPVAKPGAKPAVPAAAKAVTPAPPAPPSDVRVVTSYTQGAQISVNTTYLAVGRQRVEFPGLVTLDQCDLKRSVLLSPTAKRFRVQPDAPPPPETTAPAMPDLSAMAAAMGVAMPPGGMPPNGAFGAPIVGMNGMGQPAKSGVVTITTSLTDTLERQQMFGLEARHIKTVVTKQTTGDVCDKTPLRTEVDAWYVDLPKAASTCGRAAPVPVAPAPTDEGCQDRTETRVVGDVTLGFPVKTITTNTSGEGDKQESSVTRAEVTALEITRLDPALFEVPADYVEAKSALELTPAMASGSPLSDVLFGSTADGSSTATAKMAGMTRIGVMEPVNTSGRSSLRMKALRQELVTKLTKAPLEAVPLSGTLQVNAADAKRFECDYVLVTEITEVKTSKPGKLSRLPGGGPPKDHHEVKMTFRLYPADGTATIVAAGDVKADNGGGFSLSSALRVAAFAGQLYMGFGMGMMGGFGGMGGMGMGMGMMNPMFAMSRGSALGSSFFDPRSKAMSSMATGFGGLSGLPGMGDPAEVEVQKVVSKALDDVVKATGDRIKRPTK